MTQALRPGSGDRGRRSTQVARGAQHALPVVLCLVAVLELAAILPARWEHTGVGGAAPLLGPGAFLPLSLAVVWAALLPASRSALHVKTCTAVVATGFVGARLALAYSRWSTGAEFGWGVAVLALAGVLLGVALMVWSLLDVAAARADLARHDAARDEDHGTRPAGSPAMSATSGPKWQSVSTPWPRRDESDPDGTLIRPPQRWGQQRRRP